MTIEKKYLKTKPICKVRFVLEKEEAVGVKKVNLVGDFNNWDKKANLMKKQKNGRFVITIDLDKNKEFEFRYLIDDETWQNDSSADKYNRSYVGDAENSVVVVEE